MLWSPNCNVLNLEYFSIMGPSNTLMVECHLIVMVNIFQTCLYDRLVGVVDYLGETVT